MTTGNKAFGTILRSARERSGKSQADLARFLGVSVQYVSDVERSIRTPFARENLLAAAHFLDASAVGFVTGAAYWAEGFTLPLGVNRQRWDVASKLSARWDALTEEQLGAILDVIDP